MYQQHNVIEIKDSYISKFDFMNYAIAKPVVAR